MLLALTTMTLVAGCGDDDDDDDNDDETDDDASDEFVVLSVQPANGPVAGGTAVVVYGRSFAEGCQLFFGDAEAIDVSYTSATELSATTPAAPSGGPGAVTVKVENPDGEFAELENGFLYGEPGVGVDWCGIKWPESTTTAPGVPSENIYGHVFIEGCTEEQGSACESLTAQVGHGPDGVDPSVDEGQFAWTDAAYNTEFYPAEGAEDYNNDEFMATITEDTEGVYKYAYRVSGDGGGTWTYCDLWLGSDDGFSPSSMGTLTVTEVQYTIGYCALQYPPATTTPAGVPSENIFGRVYVEGCTDGDAFCGGILAQVGWGAPETNPSATPDDFSWTTASYNDAHIDDNNDEYQAQITESTEGSYKYAYRVSGDGGTTWTYCDLDGSENGFSTDQEGSLTVGEQTLSIGWCNLQHPPATNTTPGTPTENIFGRVYVEGCTDGDSQCGAVSGQVGWGPAGVDPSSNPGGFSWNAAAYNGDHFDDNNDEYQTTITENTEGDYKYAYRFSIDSGANWTYCDLDGTDNGFSTDQEGSLTVGNAVLNIDWCNLHWPAETNTQPATPTGEVYGRVYVDGVTGGGSDPGVIDGELGFGPLGGDPRSTPGDYTWSAASFNISDGNNDEFQATMTPTTLGDFSYAYRFTADDGATWTYCDLDGTANDFSTDQQGTMHVIDTSLVVGWCNLQFPETTTADAGDPTEAIYGRIWVDGVTGSGEDSGLILAQVGYGADGDDPSATPAAFMWTDAAYNVSVANNDEYWTPITVDDAGTYGYAYRFSVDGGTTWAYCDLDGLDNGFAVAQMGALTVTE